MGGLYRHVGSERWRLWRISRILDCPFVVLPQSILGPDLLRMEAGERATVYVRETDSLRYWPEARLAPDLALGFAVDWDVPSAERDVGVWLRADGEGIFTTAASMGDPASKCSGPDAHRRYIDLAARHRHVVTDRLHFAIAAMIAGRRATLLPNRYHKNRAVYEAWLRDLGCEWADSPPGGVS